MCPPDQPADVHAPECAEGQRIEALRERIENIESQLIEQEHRTTHVALNAYRYFDKNSPRRDAAMKALFWRVFAPYTAAVALAGGGGAIAAVTAYISYQQAQRLQDQNRLIQLEARLSAIARQADLEQQSAARTYDEITRILDQNASPGAIATALDRLPEAMIMPVTIVDSQWAPTPAASAPGTKTVYPNLVPLAQRLLIFVKSDRPAKGVEWSDDEVGYVSTAIVSALHRVGFVTAEHTTEGGCVWHCVFDDSLSPWADADIRLHALRGSRSMSQLLAARPDYSNRPRFRHLRGGELHGARLQGADLSGAQLERENLMAANLDGAHLGQAQLRGSDLSFASLKGARLNGAQLHGASLTVADLRRADLSHAGVSGANLTYAKLQGADLSGAHLQGALLTDAEMQYADLAYAELQGADLRGARLQGANFWWTSVEGGNLSSARLQGAYLAYAQLRGADLSGAQLQGADLSNSNLSGADLPFFLVPVGWTAWPKRMWLGPQLYTLPGEGDRFVTVRMPSALLVRASFGRAVVLGASLGSDALPTDDPLPRVWASRDQAEADLRARYGDDAALYIASLVEQPTVLQGAQLAGVLIDQETLNSIDPVATDPPPLVAFADANTDPEAIRARAQSPYRFPTPQELHQLAADQSREGPQGP